MIAHRRKRTRFQDWRPLVPELTRIVVGDAAWKVRTDAARLRTRFQTTRSALMPFTLCPWPKSLKALLRHAIRRFPLFAVLIS